MIEIWNGFTRALELIFSLDPEVMEISGRSLVISLTAVALASVVCLPLASLIHFNKFPGKRTLVSLIQTFYSIPTVAVGLFVFLLFSRIGPLGGLNLLFTPPVMVIGQMLLVTPILLGLTITALSGVNEAIIDTARSLGAGGFQMTALILKEARFAVLAAISLAFGRAISEIGVAILVGGNISGFTRIITTAIALEASRGDIEFAIALALILIFIALVINIILNRIQQR